MVLANGRRTLEIRRRGIATLEMVMVFPILVLLLALLMQIGSTLATQADVTIEARRAAWDRRFSDTTAEAFDFETGGTIDEEATRGAFVVSSAVDWFPDPNSRHSVGAGAWGHQQVDLNRSPNWEVYQTLMQKAGSQKLEEFGRVRDGLAELPEKVADSMSRHVEQATRSLVPDLDKLLSARTEATGAVENKQRDAQRQAENVVRAEQEKVREQVRQVEGSLLAAKRQLRAHQVKRQQLQDMLEKERKKPNRDRDKIEDLEQRIEKLDESIRNLETREIPRLQQGLKNLQNADSRLQESASRLQSNE